MLRYTLISILVAFATWDLVYSSSILYLSTTPAQSHHIWDRTLAIALKEKGHHVTFVTHFEEKETNNFTVIMLEGVTKKLKQIQYYDINSLKSKPFENVKSLFGFLTMFCKMNSETKGFQHLLESIKNNQTYDLVIADLFSFPCMYPLIEKMNFPPFIGTLQYGITPELTYFLGTDLHISYIPVNRFPYTDHMRFFQRLHNFLSTLEILYYRKYVYMPQNFAIAKQHFGSNILPLEEVENRMSLLLVNYDHVLDYPQSLPPTVIPVGGLHIQRADEMPQDLKNILDQATNGVVYFSLGSFIKWTTVSMEEIKIYVEAFQVLNQTVIWKCDRDIENLPQNIILAKWIPQNSLLAHPNVKLFITHGGALGTYEAMYYGVPLLVIPFFLDQFKNAERVVWRGVGLKLPFDDITRERLTTTIHDLLSNQKYSDNMMLLSQRFRSQPEWPLNRAVAWTEYVLKQNGSAHFHVAVRRLNFIQQYLLDLIGFLLFTTIVVIYILVFLFRRLSCWMSMISLPAFKNKTKTL